MLSKIGFKQRFMLVSLLIVLGFGVLLAVGWSTLDRVRIKGDLYNAVTQDKDLIADMLPPPEYIVEPFLLLHLIDIAKDPLERTRLVDIYNESVTAFRTQASKWSETLPEGSLKTSLLATAGEPAREFVRIAEQEFFPALEGKHPEGTSSTEVLESRLQPLFVRHREGILQAVNLAKQQIAEHEEEAMRALETGMIRALVTAGVVLAIVTVIASLVLYSVLSAVRTVVDRMRAIAEADADLSARLEVRSRDEVGELASWFNAFLDKIANLVTAVKKSSIQLTSTATEMTATSREQEATMNAFGASTNQIAAAVQEISATGTELVSSIQEVSRVAADSAQVASEGRSSLADMESTMSELAGSSESISGKLAAINEKANDINVVVATITKVADQTNLLSVNAAIESEKAGEYGRGFLVVAREIRRLADQTASATLDIEDTVSQMQSAVSAGVMEMDKFADQVRRSVETMTDVGSKLGRIIRQVEQMNQQFELVADGMASQSEGAAQINDAMGSLSSSVQQTVSSLHEFTSASDDLKRSVDGLKAEISKFKLES